jgi:hypothetical protein
MVSDTCRRASTGAPGYRKETFSKMIRSRKSVSARDPGASTMVGGVSRTSNTRSTEGRDCCTVLKERMSSRTARWRRATAAMKEKASPGVMAPEITREPAYHTMPTMLTARCFLRRTLPPCTRDDPRRQPKRGGLDLLRL